MTNYESPKYKLLRVKDELQEAATSLRSAYGYMIDAVAHDAEAYDTDGLGSMAETFEVVFSNLYHALSTAAKIYRNMPVFEKGEDDNGEI